MGSNPSPPVVLINLSFTAYHKTLFGVAEVQPGTIFGGRAMQPATIACIVAALAAVVMLAALIRSWSITRLPAAAALRSD